MNQFLESTKYASEKLFMIMNNENEKVIKFHKNARLMAEGEENLFHSMKSDGFTPEGIIDLHSYHEASIKSQREAIELTNFIDTIEFSLSAIAGAILQVAKQGISVKYSNLTHCPDGRAVGTETLKNIIWQSRNQAMHYEEGKYSRQVINCFNNLEHDFGAKLKLGNRNLAFHVLKLLGWVTYSDYEMDMEILLGN